MATRYKRLIKQQKSSESLVDLMSDGSNPTVVRIMNYFKSYCECDVKPWLIQQINDNNIAVIRRIKEFLINSTKSSIDKPLLTTALKSGRLISYYCDGSKLMGYYVVSNNQIQITEIDPISSICSTQIGFTAGWIDFSYFSESPFNAEYLTHGGNRELIATNFLTGINNPLSQLDDNLFAEVNEGTFNSFKSYYEQGIDFNERLVKGFPFKIFPIGQIDPAKIKITIELYWRDYAEGLGPSFVCERVNIPWNQDYFIDDNDVTYKVRPWLGKSIPSLFERQYAVLDNDTLRGLFSLSTIGNNVQPPDGYDSGMTDMALFSPGHKLKFYYDNVLQGFFEVRVIPVSTASSELISLSTGEPLNPYSRAMIILSPWNGAVNDNPLTVYPEWSPTFKSSTPAPTPSPSPGPTPAPTFPLEPPPPPSYSRVNTIVTNGGWIDNSYIVTIPGDIIQNGDGSTTQLPDQIFPSMTVSPDKLIANFQTSYHSGVTTTVASGCQQAFRLTGSGYSEYGVNSNGKLIKITERTGEILVDGAVIITGVTGNYRTNIDITLDFIDNVITIYNPGTTNAIASMAIEANASVTLFLNGTSLIQNSYTATISTDNVIAGFGFTKGFGSGTSELIMNPPPPSPPAGQVIRTFCQNGNLITEYTDGFGGTYGVITQYSYPGC